MSASATPIQIVTVTLGWREPDGQVVEFGGGASSGASAAPAASSSGSSSSSSSSDQGAPDGSSAIDLLA